MLPPAPHRRQSYVFGRGSSSPSCFLPFHGILVVAGEGENGSQIDFWVPSCTQHSATVTETPKTMLLRGSCALCECQDSPFPGQIRSHWSQSLAERVCGMSRCAARDPGQLYLNVVSARSWCSTAAPGAPGTTGALPACARILGSAHTPVFPLLPDGPQRGQDHPAVTPVPPRVCR